MKTFNEKFYFASLTATDENSLKKFFLRNYNTALFTETEDVEINGEKVDRFERMMMTASAQPVFTDKDKIEIKSGGFGEAEFIEGELEKWNTVGVSNKELKAKINAYRKFLEGKGGKSMIEKPQHRIKALAHLYKVKAGLEKELTRPEMRKRGGKKFEQAFDSLNPKTKSKTNPYREPTKDELKAVVGLLNNFPIAEKAAINDLSQKE